MSVIPVGIWFKRSSIANTVNLAEGSLTLVGIQIHEEGKGVMTRLLLNHSSRGI